MALSVKAYLNPDTNQQEIRRFAIDEGASASYAYLAKKIEQVFPIVRGKIFKLFWKGKFRNNLRVTVEIENLASIACHARTRSKACKKKIQPWIISYFQNISKLTQYSRLQFITFSVIMREK